MPDTVLLAFTVNAEAEVIKAADIAAQEVAQSTETDDMNEEG